MKAIDLITRSRNSSVVAFHKFVLLHRKYKTDLFCFYEGKDTQYYFPRINDLSNREHHPIICGNKKAVLDTYSAIKSKYSDFDFAFFIDSDFDECVNQDKIYNTPCYSIENLYCTEKVLKNILKNEFMLKETDSAFSKIIDLFNENQKNFHKSTSLFNVWYYTIKQKAKKSGVLPKISLNEKFPKEFVTIKIGEINSNYDLKKIKEKYPETIEVTEEDIKKSLKHFYDREPVKRHRGKYEIEFFLFFLKYLIEDCNTHKKILRNKTKFNVESAQILTQLSQYAETPECLKTFIKNCA